MAIKVVATGPGFYERYREEGHEFEIADEKDFSSRWMKRLSPKEAPAVPVKKEKKVKKS